VSPQNILIGYDGKVRLIDFGIAKATSHVNQTQVGVLKGKYAYMSPEQVLGETVGAASDVFSSGVVLFELLTGRRLFSGNSDFSILERIRYAEVLPPSVVMPSVHPELEHVVLKALARRPEDRFETAKEMADALRLACEKLGQDESTQNRAGWMQQLFAAEHVQLSNVMTKAIELGDRMALEQRDRNRLETQRMETRPMMAAKRPGSIGRGSKMSDGWLIALAGIFSVAMIAMSWWLGVDEAKMTQGSLIITSSPTGAEVIVDGEFRGITPYSANFKEGMHELVVEHPAFESAKRHVQVQGNDLINLDLKLIPSLPDPDSR
jgi:serine/threonine protein kinase